MRGAQLNAQFNTVLVMLLPINLSCEPRTSRQCDNRLNCLKEFVRVVVPGVVF